MRFFSSLFLRELGQFCILFSTSSSSCFFTNLSISTDKSLPLTFDKNEIENSSLERTLSNSSAVKFDFITFLKTFSFDFSSITASLSKDQFFPPNKFLETEFKFLP